VAAAISDKTVAVCPVHVLGNAVPMKELKQITDAHDLWLIEDTCESLGTRSEGRDVGTFGDIGTYSFYFSHHITTIEGGMVVTEDDELAELMRCLRAHGWTRHMKTRAQVEAKYPDIDPRFLFVNTGFNLRPTDINAAFGLKQLTKLRGFNRRRAEIADHWNKEFAGLIKRGEFRPMQSTVGTESTWFGYPIVCRNRELRDRLREHLEKRGIETRPVICGNLARQPAFKLIPHRISGALKGADEIMDCGLFWGSHPVMKSSDLAYVADTVHEFFK
jgi:CDP-6-deoxy-D-xylo-4-hexulose-3-dehydrase